MEDLEKLYVETSVVSYLTAKPSQNPDLLQDQQITREFWRTHLGNFEVYVSEAVFAEAERGDSEAAKRRIKILEPLHLLPTSGAVDELVAIYLQAGLIPEEARLDATHIAMASANGMNYLLTWNCRHMANSMVRSKLAEINQARGIPVPRICTP